MCRRQFMFSCSREMYANQLSYLCLALLILPLFLVSEALNNGRNRRRPSISDAKEAVEEATEKSEVVPDQVALASSHTERNQYRRGGAYSTDAAEGDYSYGNLEMNLIRPESKPVHSSGSTKYKSSQRGISGLDDTETAEEYVAKAMEMYGTRLHEPIRIPNEPEQTAVAQVSHEEQRHAKFDYYDMANKQQEQSQPQQQPQAQQSDAVDQPQEHSSRRAYLEAQLQAQLQQHAQLMAEQQLESKTERGQMQAVSQHPAPVYEKDPVTRSYEVYDEHSNVGYDSPQAVERLYRTKYVYQPAYYGASSEQEADRSHLEEDNIRVSASTELPKAEIMKQIEKSVMKYMKELEAEGKIGTAPQVPQEPKSYYKVVTVPAEDKRHSSTTIRPRYTNSNSNSNSHYHNSYGGSSSNSGKQSASATATNSAGGSGYSISSRHHSPKHSSKQHYQSETETNYQAPAVQQNPEMSDAMAPNVEFIYKIKTRAPLQTATVKTVSKPYTLPLKSSYGSQFDHSAALKNLQDFDLSHVVTTQEPEDTPTSVDETVTGKPKKLYFNSDIYHDINSLPYKAEKNRALAAEYRKVKANDLVPDYKGYPGYFAEPAPMEADKEGSSSSGSTSDDGYPIMNPYQFVLKKEAIPSKYDDGTNSASASWEQPRSHGKPQYASVMSAQSALEYDSYSPKFNNNPEGYGYQHTYKAHSTAEREREVRDAPHSNHKYAQRHTNGKRGKRGGAPHPSGIKKGTRTAIKDIEANLALRPPPKV